MADLKEFPQATSLTLNAHQTALCIIPPSPLAKDANRLRALYDQAFEKWPAHINLIYPFVSFDRLPAAVDLIRSNLSIWLSKVGNARLRVCLNKPGHFTQRRGNVVYLAPDDSEGVLTFSDLRAAILEGFKQPADRQWRGYQPHLTIGQSKANDNNARDYLLSKAELLPPIEWDVGQLAIMVREKAGNMNKMKLWGTIDLDESATFNQIAIAARDVGQDGDDRETSSLSSTASELSLQDLHINPERGGSGAESRITYMFSDDAGIWTPAEASSAPEDEELIPSALKVSSYNVLVESMHPPATDRYPILLHTLISKTSVADVLVLQEVSDDFLAYILGQDAIRTMYPFATHGPPDQKGIGPLSSLRNVVALSRSNFTWSWLPLGTNHKGAVLLALSNVGKMDDSGFVPTIIAGVHLSSGLFDYAVAARKQQLERLFHFLSATHANNPKVIAGDFNMTTSSITHEEAAERKLISPQSIATLPVLESMLQYSGYLDSWLVAQTGMKDMVSPARLERDFTQLYDGEQGATFDPLENSLAAASSGSTANPRPHRYDRILFGEDDLKVTAFNMFGFPIKRIDEATGDIKLQFPSDHWGIRASLELGTNGGVRGNTPVKATPLDIKKAHPNFDDPVSLKICQEDQSIVPSPESAEARKAAFLLLKHIIQDSSLSEPSNGEEIGRSKFSIVVTTVGSSGLGVWTESSDIDCLCVSSISANVFFELIIQRLRNRIDLGVKIIRRVKPAFGTMLELEINGIKFDLQYCPAAAVAERWLEVPNLPQSSPLFNLSLIPRMKLQPYRDQAYLQRTIQNPATFRLLHRIIKGWAKYRGIYSSRFGYLGGIHITLMLSRLMKLLPPNPGSAADILCTFFNHYGNFNWGKDAVYDPIFHGKPPRNYRPPREGMIIFTLHTPIINVARSTSIPSMRKIVDEMKRAENLISEGNANWAELLGIYPKTGKSALSSSADEFLKSYNSYIKINVQYWSLSLAKGSSLVGWVESRCLDLLDDLYREFPDIQARIWPARFTQNEDHENSTPAQEEHEYQGCYLIGLRKADHATDPTRTFSKLDRKLAQDTLQASMDQFASSVQSNKKYFNLASAWVDVTHVKQDSLGPLKLDDRNWGIFTNQDFNSDDSDSDSDIGFGNFDDNEADTEADSIPSTRKKGTHTSTSKPVSTAKLRPASDILNRLRWDPSFHGAEYIIGYEDRFLGAKEIPLDRWKSEQTDEEFIPQHRILYFKRKADGKVVWDRETRRDEIFGSGAGKGDE
ncbi:DUF455 domain-containing protein [Histoplasma capsulatum G186AR]|uniref:polynucleotide adenylyltransferase n=2 Tax=Ajellomyces capsulatus TaxID=5037 RepID=C0NES5_AJECG|nr:DUF455 domain-containing protein [Histoplasma capsulatum G186AR]EEH09746.1 DUF455 domain-containing protein [Histoplasma capsulatum G186AR]KAG5288831.1 DUF455 domain-containing protein [Histoplasma capsulatum]QSS73234.1 DUF455 domain-containing protein [Histoplasma capsulatum G186AR]